MSLPKPSDTYSPMYFLASVGAGGVAVGFFMWLMFWIPHPGRTVPVYEDIAAAFADGTLLTQAMILGAMAGIALFVFLNIKALVWNLGRFGAWRASAAGQQAAQTNAQSQQMALPLALAMAVNGGFVAGLVFVPGLWGIVEYLFPVALSAFLLIAVLAFRLYAQFLGRVLSAGGFDHTKNGGFGQVLPAFAFGMIGVGMAAPAAMSGNSLVVGVAVLGSTVMLVAALLIAVVGVVLGLQSALAHGTTAETAPTLTILVPLVTILGILMMRQSHGLGEAFGAHTEAADTFLFLARAVAIQIAVLLSGVAVLARHAYGRRFLWGRETSVMSYALVCPGVGFAVMWHFFVHKGLIAVGLVAKFSAAYWIVLTPALVAHLAMAVLVLVLNRRHFAQPRAAMVPAE